MLQISIGRISSAFFFSAILIYTVAIARCNGADSSNARSECQANVYDYYPYPNNNNYFYQCINGYLTINTCPQNSQFDANQKKCIQPMATTNPTTPSPPTSTQTSLTPTLSTATPQTATTDFAPAPTPPFNQVIN